MLYCFREREMLMNINELLAGFRLFPSYLRVGGLREDMPRGFQKRSRAFLDRFPGKLDEYETLMTKNPIWQRSHARRRRDHAARSAMQAACVGPIARAAGGDYDVRRAFPYLGYETYEFDVIGATNGDVYDRYLVRMAEMRESVKICRQALERITPVGEWAVDDQRIVPPPKDQVYTEMEALIQHFLIYSQGFTVPAGEAYVPVEGPRGEHGCYFVSDGTNRPWRVHMRAPGLHGLPGAAQVHRRRHDRGRHRRDRIARRRDGRRGSMSFHPAMPYGDRAVASLRARDAARRAGRSSSRPRTAQRFEEFAAHYPPEQRMSAVLHALYLAQEQQGYISRNADAPRRRGDRHARPRTSKTSCRIT